MEKGSVMLGMSYDCMVCVREREASVTTCPLKIRMSKIDENVMYRR